MLIENHSIELLADPHLGRRFVNNVPLHRRGERERMIWRQFEQAIRGTTAAMHVCLGDLFDAALVSYDTIWRAAAAYLKASENTRFVVLRGNHDASRDLEKVSALDLFAAIMRDKVTVVSEPTALDPNIVAFPWHPTIPAAELVERFAFNGETIAFGHWDVDLRCDPFNLIPTKEFAAAGITTAYTGHVHLPQRFVRDGVTVHVVGAMSPLAHGEDPASELYVTAPLAEVLADPGAFRDKCLRVVLQPGETLDVPIDCLQLVVQRAEEEAASIAVELAGFDLMALFAQAFDEEKVASAIREQMLARYQAELVRG